MSGRQTGGTSVTIGLAVIVAFSLSGFATFGPATAPAGGSTHSPARCGWKIVSSPSVERKHGHILAGVDAISPQNVWVIGGSIDHWNGLTWTAYKPKRAAADQQLEAIAAVSSQDIWVVGGDPAVGGEPGRLIDHWNGKSWTKVPAPKSDRLDAVAVSPSGAVWAAGGMPVSGTEDRAYASYWNGTKWIGMVPPVGNIYPDDLYGIAPITSNDVLVVGRNGYAAKWDGKQWTALNSPIQANAIAAISETDAWAVGGGNAGAIEHWNGTSWSAAHLTIPAKWLPMLESVSVVGANDVWAVGEMLRINSAPHVVHQRALVAHWNGKHWTAGPTPTVHAKFSEFSGISTLPNGDVWAVGSYGEAYAAGKLRPLIEHYSHC